MKTFEMSFPAQIEKYYSIATAKRVPECLRALQLLTNLQADDC